MKWIDLFTKNIYLIMEKKYRLKRDISTPMGCIDAGTESHFYDGFHCFPYAGKENDFKSSYTGNSFMISDPTIFSDWFEEASSGVYGVRIDWTIISHPYDLSKVTTADQIRFIGTQKECEEFREEHQPIFSKSELISMIVTACSKTWNAVTMNGAQDILDEYLIKRGLKKKEDKKVNIRYSPFDEDAFDGKSWHNQPWFWHDELAKHDGKSVQVTLNESNFLPPAQTEIAFKHENGVTRVFVDGEEYIKPQKANQCINSDEAQLRH